MASENEPDDENLSKEELSEEELSEEELTRQANQQEPRVRKRPVIDSTKPIPFADELGIIDISEPVFGGRGRLFSAAGREAPVAEFNGDFLVLHSASKPFTEDGPAEEITSRWDERGILLDELGHEKTIPGARFQGHQLYWLAEYKPGTLKHIAGWLDEQNKPHRLFSDGDVMLVDDVFKLRNKTHDGELTIFPGLDTE